MDRYFRKVATFSLVLTLVLSPAAAVFSIELAGEPRDYSTISPGVETVQIVQVVDDDEDPVNMTRLEDNSITLRFDENGSWQNMEYLNNGYYYGSFDNFEETDITYELEDAAPASPGKINTSEHLEAGKLDIELLTNVSEDMEAGEELFLEAELEDLAEYYAVDTDGSGDASNEDTFIRDRGGDGTYSDRADRIIAGASPEETVSTSASNPWNSIEHPVAFSDGSSGDNWDPSNDAILVDRNNGGTVSVEADEALNTGENSEVDSEEGQEFKEISDIRDNVYVVSADSNIDAGEVTVYDNDSDGVYTHRSDRYIAGVNPNEGTSITRQNQIPSSMEISSYDESSGDSWNGDRDSLIIDNDDDGSYTGTPDLLLAGSSPSPGTNLITDDVDAWNDGDAMKATSGDVEVRDSTSGDATRDDEWDPNVDAIWLESGETNGFQADEDTVLAGNPSTGMSPSETSGLFNQWDKISAHRADDDDTFDLSEDAIIREANGGGTFSTESDEVVAGTDSLSSGADFAVSNGIPGDWTLDVVDINSGDQWDSSRDSIVIDRNDGGTYSTVADEITNSGTGTPDAGTNLEQLNSLSTGDVYWADVDNDGRYGSGDEIFRDLDEDEIYTSEPDMSIAGLPVDTAGAGTSLTTDNPWSDVTESLMFYNGTGTGWDSSGDFIARDLDQDGQYTSDPDIIVQSGENTPSNGAELLETSGRNLTFPNVVVTFTDGNTTTEIKELGFNPDGTYSNTVELPDKPDSTIIAQIHANAPKSEIDGSVSRIIETREQGIGFSVESDLELSLDRAGIYERNINLENFLDSSNRIHAEAEEDIADSLEMDSEITLAPGSEENFTVSVNATPLEELSGEIVFTENSTGLTDTTDIDVEIPDCPYSTDRLCTYSSEINMTLSERRSYENSVTVENIWSETVDVQASLTGDISEYVEIESETFQLADRKDFNMTFTPEDPGTYTGELVLSSGGDSLTYSLTMNADVIELERGMSVSPESVDLGTMPEGNDATETFTVENTGTLDIENMSASSERDIDEDLQETLQADEDTEFDVTFQDIESQTGSFTVSGDTMNGEVSQSIDVTVSLVEPVEDLKSELRSEIRDLRQRASTTSTLNEITEVETRMGSIDTEWNKGNYEEAQSIYQNSLSDLNSIEITEDTNQTGTGERPGSPGTAPGTNPGTNPDESSGGSGIIIFIILLLLVLVAGFVVYTSYYPEEGDPLYELLGDR